MSRGPRIRIGILATLIVSSSMLLISLIPAKDLGQVTIFVATVVTAAATAIIAVANYLLIRATRAQADASRAMIDEVQRDRALQWGAYVVREFVTNPDSIQLHNLGRGPALGCFYCPRPPSALWRRTSVINLAPGEKQLLEIRVEPSLQRPADSFFGSVGGQATEVWFCLDQVGRSYRFTSVGGEPDLWPPALGAASANQPAWASAAAAIRVAPPT